MTKNIHTVPSYAELRGWGLGPEAEGTQLLSVAPRYFTEWYTTHGTEFGTWGASVRAHVLACEGVGVRACVRETVGAITFVSVFLQFCSS